MLPEILTARPLDPLTPAEESVVRLAAQGLNEQEIADHHGWTLNSVKTIKKAMFRRMGARNIAHAVALYLASHASMRTG